LKILIVTEYFYPEEFKINEIALEWQKKGYQVDVLTNFPTYPAGKIYDNYKNKWYDKDNYKGITVHRVKSITGYKENLFKKLLKYFTFMFLGTFVAMKIGKRYDFVFGFDIGALTGMTPAIVVQKFYKKPVTLWIQDIWPDSVYAYGFKQTKLLTYCLNSFVKFIYKNSTVLVVSAEGFIEKIKLFSAKQQKIEYLPNWADALETNVEAFQFSKEEKIHFTFAGNIGKVQNLDNVIKAFGSIDNKLILKAQLNIIGDGSYIDDLQQLVKNENIKNVIFWGRKPRQEMSKYFKASDFLIVSLIDKPIFSLTVPAKIQTYIAAKKPILAILNGDAAKIIEDNKLGFSAEPNNLEQIRKILEKSILLSEDEKNILIKNSQFLTENTFNKDRIIKRLLGLTTGEDQ